SITPSAVATATDGARAYVVGAITDATGAVIGTVQVIEVACNRLINTLTLPGFSPRAVAVSPAAARTYVVSNNQLQVIDTNTHHALGAPLSLRGGVEALALSLDGSGLYVTEYYYIGGGNGGSVRAIDPTLLEQVIQGRATLDQLTGAR